MNKKKTDIMEEMKNSQQFLNKLNGIKKASKDIKQKNKLVSHRNIWVKEYKYLSRLQRDADTQIRNYFEDFDRYFQFEMEERQIFGRENYKSYSQYKRETEEDQDTYQNKIWSQLRSLPLLLSKIKQTKGKKKEEFNLEDVEGIVSDIGLFLEGSKQENAKIHDKIMNEKVPQSILFNQSSNANGEDENEFFLQTVLQKQTYVKGFDSQKSQLKKIEEGESHIMEYLYSMNDRLSQDQIIQVISEYRHASDLLKQTLQLQLQKIDLDYEEVLSLNEELVGESQNFQKINHIYQTYIGRGKLLTLYYERLSIQFPKINRKVLQRITQYIEGKIYKQRKISAVKRNYIREKQEILQKVERQVNERIQNKIKKAQQEAENLQRRQQKLKLQKELEGLRSQYEKRQMEKQKIAKQQESKRIQEEKKKQAIRKLYLDELNKKASQIHEIKQKKQMEETEFKKKEKIKEENERKQIIQKNKPKIQMRHSVERKKIQKKLQQQKEKEQAEVQKEKRINKAVQKYSFRPNVEPSDQRLNAPTQALKKKKQTQYDKADKIQLQKVHGYNINQLMGDMRFRLNTMLGEAGLSNTNYAREVLNGMSKKPNQ